MAAPAKKSKKKAIPPQMQRGISKKNVGNSKNVAKGKAKSKPPPKPKGKGGKGKKAPNKATGGKAITATAAARGMKRTATKKDLSYQQIAAKGGGGKRASKYYGPGAGGGRVSGVFGGGGKVGVGHSRQSSKTLSRSQPSRTQIMLNSNEKRGSVVHLFNSGKNKKKKSKK